MTKAPMAQKLWQNLMMIGAKLIIIIAVFLSLLQHFVLTLPQPRISADIVKNTDGIADGIVVPTGGQARLHAGLDLLADGRAPRLLLSGVGQGITKDMIAQSLALDPDRAAQLACCVILDFQAENTKGNARATQKWANDNGLSRIVLVTSDYHMPRAALEFAYHMPERTLILYPISAPDLADKSWYSDWQTLRLYSREFLKYSLRRLRITA